jgi:hypothetical protein
VQDKAVASLTSNLPLFTPANIIIWGHIVNSCAYIGILCIYLDKIILSGIVVHDIKKEEYPI